MLVNFPNRHQPRGTRARRSGRTACDYATRQGRSEPLGAPNGRTSVAAAAPRPNNQRLERAWSSTARQCVRGRSALVAPAAWSRTQMPQRREGLAPAAPKRSPATARARCPHKRLASERFQNPKRLSILWLRATRVTGSSTPSTTVIRYYAPYHNDYHEHI